MLTKLINGKRIEVADTEEARLRAEWASADRRRAQEAEHEAAMQYRRDRKERYLAELGVEPNQFEEVVGDVLDAVITQIDRLPGDKSVEFQALVDKIRAIKADIPRPQ